MSATGGSLGRTTLVLATGNPDKVVELRALLGERYVVEPRPTDLAETVEDGDTLEANALKKAREVAERSGALSVADDTGLFVYALDGRPGVRTGRYAGENATYDDNVDKLLAELADRTGPEERSADFRTVIAARWTDGTELTVEGRVAGWITPERRGDGGFGYDPVFVPTEGDGRSFAEMSTGEKNALSHRARAIDALLVALAKAGDPTE